jgi:hypothetical protein
MLISCGKKMKLSLFKMTFFSNTVCPVGFFAPAKTLNGMFLVYKSYINSYEVTCG